MPRYNYKIKITTKVSATIDLTEVVSSVEPSDYEEGTLNHLPTMSSHHPHFRHIVGR